MLRRCIYNLPFMILFVILCAVLFFFDGHADNDRLWDNYYIIAVPEGDAELILQKEFFGDADILSYYNTSIRYNDFAEMKSVPLSQIKDRFVEGDPRIDPFIEGAVDYFFSTDENAAVRELIYVGSSKSVWDFYFQTRRAAGAEVDNWIFPDFSIRNRLTTLALFIVCWLFGIWLLSGMRIVAAAAGLPWIISVVVNGAGLLPAAVSVYIISILVIRETYPAVLYYLNYRKIRVRLSIYLYAAAFAAAFIGSLVLSLGRNLPAAPIIISTAAGFTCVFIYYSLKSHLVRMQEHRLFFPVSISSKAGTEISGNKIPEIAAAAAAVILLPMFVLFYQQNIPVEVPVPQKPVESFSSWTWESLEFIDKSYDGLVNAADLLTHAAYQEGFMYDREWRFPVQDEKLLVGGYVAVNNKIEFKETCIQQFTENWYTSIIKPELNTGLTALLLSQQSPGGIILKSDISEASSSFKPVNHVFISLLAILPLLGHIFSILSISVRRKGQLA
ncbi:MAG TPA: hypothetical protein DCO79_13345 [Spirochaeta sp.]|nr:hypothetical protein [Spirochaeta sp.]